MQSGRNLRIIQRTRVFQYSEHKTLTLQATVWHDNRGAGMLLKHVQSLE